MNHMLAMYPAAASSFAGVDTTEMKAAERVVAMFKLARKSGTNNIHQHAHQLWKNYPDTLWCALGLYWYYLFSGMLTRALVCEQMVLARQNDLDSNQERFYKQCKPLQQKWQASLKVPEPVAIKFPLMQPKAESTSIEKLAVSIQNSPPRRLHVCSPAALLQALENEGEKSNRDQLESMIQITSEKILPQVTPNVFRVLRRLQQEQPNMSEAIELITGETLARRMAGAAAKLPPLLLLGSPGVGKTRFISEISSSMGLPCVDIPLAGSSDPFKIIGLSRYWGNAGAGIIAKTLCHQDTANPVFIFDEIDKAGRSEKGSPHDAVLGLLEEHTARQFKDEFLQVTTDVSHASFLATANSVDNLSEALLSRFIIVEIPPLSQDQRIQVIHSIYAELLAMESYGIFFCKHLPVEIAERLATDASCSPRQARHILLRAMQRACMKVGAIPEEGALQLQICHLPDSAIQANNKMGFIR